MSKAVLVYGIGISGCGAADILARQGKRVLLYNDAGHEVDADLKELLAKSGGQIVIGKKKSAGRCGRSNCFSGHQHGKPFGAGSDEPRH